MDGFWGLPTSTIDWCESNYIHSAYVCEWFNTASSFAMVVAGVLGVVLHSRRLERRFTLAFVLLAAVGIGSVLFHSTLRFSLQVLDEVPMLYLVLVITFILLDDGKWPRRGLILTLSSIAVALSVLCVATRGPNQPPIFWLCFTTFELFCLVRVYGLHRRGGSPSVRSLYRWGMSSYAFGVAAWMTDLKACGLVRQFLHGLGLPYLQLHAVWHVAVSVGFYCLLMVIAWHRGQAVGLEHAGSARNGVLI